MPTSVQDVDQLVQFLFTRSKSPRYSSVIRAGTSPREQMDTYSAESSWGFTKASTVSFIPSMMPRNSLHKDVASARSESRPSSKRARAAGLLANPSHLALDASRHAKPHPGQEQGRERRCEHELARLGDHRGVKVIQV